MPSNNSSFTSRPVSMATASICMARPAHHTASCQLNSPSGKVQHVIDLTFDNVHFTRDNPNVPSDLEQMPNLLNFMTRNGSLLSQMHTPLIAHTANDILTTLTGVYADKHGQSVANSYRVYNTDGTSSCYGGATGPPGMDTYTDPSGVKQPLAPPQMLCRIRSRSSSWLRAGNAATASISGWG